MLGVEVRLPTPDKPSSAEALPGNKAPFLSCLAPEVTRVGAKFGCDSRVACHPLAVGEQQCLIGRLVATTQFVGSYRLIYPHPGTKYSSVNVN